MTERVLLLHGIWMRGFMMARLAKHLDAHGYVTETIDYPSLSKGADACADDDDAVVVAWRRGGAARARCRCLSHRSGPSRCR